MPFRDNATGTPADGVPAGARVPAGAWALATVVLGLALTLWLAQVERRRSEDEARRVFVQETIGVAEALHAELDHCGQLIRAFQSIFLASEHVSEREYQRAYRNIQPGGAARLAYQAGQRGSGTPGNSAATPSNSATVFIVTGIAC